MSTRRQIIRGLAAVMLAATVAPWPHAARAGEAPAMRAVDASTSMLLEKLDEEGMPDVVLWVLERVASDPDAAAELKKEVPFRRASALVGTSRNESDSRKRTAIFDEAGREIDRFLAEGPTGRRAIDAFSQKGNLLIQRGRMKVEQAKRPGEDAKKVLAEAAAFFDGAIAALQGISKPGQPIKTATNAEDAVVKLLREVDAEIEELSGGKASGDEKGQRKKPVRRTAAAEKQLERLEEEQEELRTRLMQTRLMIGETFFEKSRALESGSKEWQQALESSAKEHKELAEKYPSKGAALFARFYQGRNEALLGKREQALATLATVYAIDAPAPMIVALRAKALAAALDCWLAEKKYDAFDDTLLKFALKPIPGGKPDPDWLTLKYRAAALLDARADALPANEKAKKGLLLRDAKKLAVEVATANKDFANEARELAAKLGKEVPDDRSEGDVTFASLMAEAKIALGGLQAKQAAAKQLLAEGKADEAQAKLAEAAPDRDAAIAGITRALREAADEDIAAINNARYMLTYLLYDGRRFHDAAALGTFLAERYPNAMGSRQAAKISLSSWQLLGKQSDPGWGQQAKESAVSLATLITRTWPTEAESAEALVVLLSAAIENRDAAAIVASIDQLPKESPRRPELLQRAGAALWREVQEKRRLEETVRPDAKTLDGWKARAKESLDEGLAAAVAPPSKIAVAAALSRVQIALEDGDLKLAGTLLDNPVYGPWAVVQAGSPEFSQGPLAEGGLTVALRYFIQSEQVDKAQQAMDGLEKVAGTGEEASTKLTSLYLAMGRDLQGQLEALNTAGGAADDEVRRKAAAILAGFERFLDKVAERDSKISSQMWVATTYLTLGSGGKSGSVVAADKAQAYLDRAAAVYDGLLKKGGEEIGKFEPSIRLRMANIFRERQKWEAAQEQIDWILADAKRQNSLETQMQAAEVLQAAGEALAAKEPDKADEMLRQATVGRKAGTSVIWGWGGIANKLSRQVGSGGKADEMFYAARLAIPRCMLDRALLSGKPAEKRDELLNAAKKSIAVTRKLYPAMGGPSNAKQFEKLLKEIQKAQGKAAATGFKEFEEQEAAAAQKPVAATP